MKERKMANATLNIKVRKNKNEAPAEAFQFDCGQVIYSLEGEDKNNIKLDLYDGGVTKHWYWGNLAFDLSGMKLAKKSIGILDSHDTAKRVGFSTGASFDKRFILEGVFLSNASAQELKADALEGFPFEASLRFDSLGAKIEFVKEGETAEVNGREFKGEGAIIRKCRIMEGSICVFGALNNTKAQVFETVNKTDLGENKMSDKALTIEEFQAASPELYDRIIEKGKADGETAERKLFAEVLEAAGDDFELACDCYKEGLTKEEALAKANEKLRAELAAKAEAQAAEEASTDGDTQATRDAAEQQFSDDADRQNAAKIGDEENAEKPKTFMKAVEAYEKKHKCSRTEAIDACADEYPELHEAMRDGAKQ